MYVQLKSLDALYRTLAAAAQEEDPQQTESILRRAIQTHFGAGENSVQAAAGTASRALPCPQRVASAQEATALQTHVALAAEGQGQEREAERGDGETGREGQGVELPIQMADRMLVADTRALLLQNRLAKVRRIVWTACSSFHVIMRACEQHRRHTCAFACFEHLLVMREEAGHCPMPMIEASVLQCSVPVLTFLTSIRGRLLICHSSMAVADGSGMGACRV